MSSSADERPKNLRAATWDYITRRIGVKIPGGNTVFCRLVVQHYADEIDKQI